MRRKALRAERRGLDHWCAGATNRHRPLAQLQSRSVEDLPAALLDGEADLLRWEEHVTGDRRSSQPSPGRRLPPFDELTVQPPPRSAGAVEHDQLEGV